MSATLNYSLRLTWQFKKKIENKKLALKYLYNIPLRGIFEYIVCILFDLNLTETLAKKVFILLDKLHHER
jgi:hypothetical protein